MLLKAAAEHEVDLSKSWMIGDSASDVEAGHKAGCKTMRIQPASKKDDGNADLQAQSLLEAVAKILQTSADSKAKILANKR
jgi:histidinol phosphatase-like enzyme